MDINANRINWIANIFKILGSKVYILRLFLSLYYCNLFILALCRWKRNLSFPFWHFIGHSHNHSSDGYSFAYTFSALYFSPEQENTQG